MSDLITILDVLIRVGAVAVLVLLLWLRSYVKQKGENFATKEDIRTITREVEKVRAEYKEQFESLAQQNRLLLERVKQRHDLRLAALGRRLAAHQEAYALWWKLLGSVHKPQEIAGVVLECQNWWVHNRLYLEPDVAQAFSIGYHAASSHSEYLQARLSRPEIEDNWRKIRIVGETIVKAVQLPNLQEGEYQPIGEGGGAKGEQPGGFSPR